MLDSPQDFLEVTILAYILLLRSPPGIDGVVVEYILLFLACTILAKPPFLKFSWGHDLGETIMDENLKFPNLYITKNDDIINYSNHHTIGSNHHSIGKYSNHHLPSLWWLLYLPLLWWLVW